MEPDNNNQRKMAELRHVKERLAGSSWLSQSFPSRLDPATQVA